MNTLLTCEQRDLVLADQSKTTREVYAAIIEFQQEHSGAQPSLRQLADPLGLNAHSPVAYHTGRLLDANLLVKTSRNRWYVNGSIWTPPGGNPPPANSRTRQVHRILSDIYQWMNRNETSSYFYMEWQTAKNKLKEAITLLDSEATI